jgi:hypothetical protein
MQEKFSKKLEFFSWDQGGSGVAEFWKFIYNELE